MFAVRGLAVAVPVMGRGGQGGRGDKNKDGKEGDIEGGRDEEMVRG